MNGTWRLVARYGDCDCDSKSFGWLRGEDVAGYFGDKVEMYNRVQHSSLDVAWPSPPSPRIIGPSIASRLLYVQSRTQSGPLT